MPSDDRDALLRALSGPAAAAALEALRGNPEWLAGVPPAAYLDELLELGLAPDSAHHRLARDWDRECLGAALWAAFLRVGTTTAAWLVKCFPLPRVWRDLAERASATTEDVQIRVYLVQALDYVAFAGDLGWDELDPYLHRWLADPAPGIRASALGVVASLPWSARTAALAQPCTRDADRMVAMTAQQVLTHLRPAPK